MSTLPPPSPLGNESQAADYINSNPRTMERWRHTGDGPPFIKVGRLVRYRFADLDRWLDQQTRKHTGESVESSRQPTTAAVARAGVAAPAAQ